MATYDNTYSRLVAWLKVVLPLTALAILSTLFLLAREPDGERSIPYSSVDPSQVAREQRLAGPAYAGMTADGAAVSVSAETARPGSDGAFEAQGLVARIEPADGGNATLHAAEGTYDVEAGSAELRGGVVVASSTGWRVEGPAFQASLEAGTVESGGPVTAEGPAGRLEAGSMSLTTTPEGRALLFEGGVRVVYDPAKRR